MLYLVGIHIWVDIVSLIKQWSLHIPAYRSKDLLGEMCYLKGIDSVFPLTWETTFSILLPDNEKENFYFEQHFVLILNYLPVNKLDATNLHWSWSMDVALV